MATSPASHNICKLDMVVDKRSGQAGEARALTVDASRRIVLDPQVDVLIDAEACIHKWVISALSRVYSSDKRRRMTIRPVGAVLQRLRAAFAVLS